MSSVNIDGSKIKTLREQQELTQLYLATVVGVTTDTISRWENRHYQSIKRENAERLAQALEVALEELLEKVEVEPEQSYEQQQGQTPPSAAGTAKLQRFFSVKRVGMALLAVSLLTGALWLLLPSKNIRITCKRIVPEHAAPNVPFPVVIRIKADTDQKVPILIREELIGDGQARGRGPAGEIKDFGKSPRWIGTLHNGQAQFIYLVTPIKNSKGETSILFSGEITSHKGRKTGSKVEGAATVRVAPYHWADGDQDYRISDNEILIAYETYSSPGESGIDFSALERLWLAGRYTWGEATASFEIANTPLPEE